MSVLSSSSSSSLARSLHPAFLPLVEECQRSDRIKGKIAVTGVKSSLLSGPTDGKCDRFILSIPYCGSYVKWEVLFNHHTPLNPPDFIFQPDDDDFIPQLENLKSLVEWDVSNAQCLVSLIEELLVEYRRYQLLSLSMQEPIEFQYTTLKESYDENLIDVKCLSLSKNEVTIKFHVSLDVDYSTVPAYFRKDCPGNYYASLSIFFKSATKVESSLMMSSALEKILGGKDSIILPKWTETTYLMDYVPSVKKVLQGKVNFLMESYIKRKEYLASILNVLGNSVLEYDTDSYKMIAFFFENQGFCFITQVKFSDFFPKESPSLSLFSVYYKNAGQPLQVTVPFPFNSHLEADENIKNMITRLVETAPQFMDLSKQKGRFL